ncbi:Prostaglandin reductase 3 like protein [Argiope bruennichi]|uniref:Prostaglandin reductase 3 like protein n=1 Tax=Argiope bruennichi TaxID=94029 RepID=A0A8T0E1P1_ARGBR|nr:Prostaglandin reductase 3 like protein [Argiope bruennichi]
MSFAIPRAFRKLIVRKLTPAFKDAIEIVQQNVVPPRSQEVLIKNKFLGINSSDISAAAGFSGATASLSLDKQRRITCDILHNEYPDGVNVIWESTGGYMFDVLYKHLAIKGRMVIIEGISQEDLKKDLIKDLPTKLLQRSTMLSGFFLPHYKSDFSSLFKFISLEDVSRAIESLGCDRPINSKEESLADILHNEYPLAFRVSGGYMFDVLYKHLAIKGRMVIIEGISQEDLKKDLIKDLPTKLLQRSTMLSGFFLPHYKSDIPHYLSLLVRLLHEQSLKLLIDDGSSHGKPFKGLEDVSRAVEYLQSGKSKGKVIVHL